MGGRGRGLPAAIVRPSHEHSIFSIQLEPTAKIHGTEVSLSAVGIDIGLWSGFCALGYLGYRKVSKSRQAV